VDTSSTIGTSTCNPVVSLTGGFDYIEVSGFSTASPMIAAGTNIRVNLAPLWLPPSTDPVTTFELFTAYTSFAEKIDYISTGLTLKLDNPNVFKSGSSASINTPTTVLSENAQYFFKMVLYNPIPNGGYLTVAIPSQVSATSGTLTLTCFSLCAGTATSTLASGVFTFNGIFPTTVSGSQTIGFYIDGFTNPASSAETDPFTITSYTSTGGSIDQGSTYTVQAEQGTITIDEFSPYENSKLLDTPTYYYVRLTPEHAVATSYTLVITLPSDSFLLTDTTSCSVSGLGSSTTCSISSNVVTLGALVDSAGSDGTTYEFYVSGIRNPYHMKQTGSIGFELQFSGSPIDTGSYIMSRNVIEQNEISSFSVSSNNY